MVCLDLTLPTAAENLACDEVLLDWCEETGAEVLRLWEPACEFVVVGYSNRVAREADTTACAAQGVPILRRSSGGGTVLQGPGCLNYALVLRIPSEGPLTTVAGTNRFVMDRHRAAVQDLLGRSGADETAAPAARVEVCGHTDLALDGKKFSGNAQRRLRRALLFHGTLLCGFDLARVTALLPPPSRPPDYRRGRSHGDFLTNLQVSAGAMKDCLQRAWGTQDSPAGWPQDRLPRLVEQRYGRPDWNLKF